MNLKILIISPFYIYRLNLLTIGGLFLVYVYGDMIHPLLFRSPETGDVAFPFLPLIVYSTTCSIVLIHAWALSVSFQVAYLPT